MEDMFIRDDLSGDGTDVYELGDVGDGLSAWVVQVGVDGDYVEKAQDKTSAKPHGTTSVYNETQNGEFADRSGALLRTPYDFRVLSRFLEMNNTLSQCVQAMATNIELFGHGFVCVVTDPRQKKKLSKQIEAERKRLEAFFDTINSETDFTQLREKMRIDLETTGNAYFEVVRDSAGTIAGLEYLPSVTMRLTIKQPQWVETMIHVKSKDGYEWEEQVVPRRFRRYCQFADDGTGMYSRVWFKELGDPRVMNALNGMYVDSNPSMFDGSDIDTSNRARPKHIPSSDIKDGFLEATEIIHFKLHNPLHEYGLPRWAGNMLALLGGRDADEVNLNFFKKGAMWDIAIMVSGGGKVNESTVKRIKEFVQKGRGKDNAHSVLVLQSETGKSKVASSQPDRSKIEIRELNARSDMMFKDYQNYNTDRIRSSFRLPPIYVGLVQDYTDANAETSKKVAEEQLFQPERFKFDTIMNRQIMPDIDAKYHVFYSKGPRMSKVQEAKAIMEGFAKSAMTGREQRALLAQVIDIKLDDVDLNEEIDQIWLNHPHEIGMKFIDAGLSMSQQDTGIPEDDVRNPVGNPEIAAEPVEDDDQAGTERDIVPSTRKKVEAPQAKKIISKVQKWVQAARLAGVIDEYNHVLRNDLDAREKADH